MADSEKPAQGERHLDDDEMKKARIGFATWHQYSANTASEAWMTHAAHPDYPQFPRPQFPRVHLGVNDATIEYLGKTYACVNLAAAEMLKAILNEAPKPLGLRQQFGPHPERTLQKLPAELFNRLESQLGNKGYLFIP